MGNTPTARGENGRKQPRSRPIGPDHREVDDHWRDNLTKAETVTIAAIENGVPALVEAREIVAGFHAMIRARRAATLASWIERASQSLVASLANGARRDEVAVRAGILSTWSNGQTES